MANKTVPTDESVKDFLNGVEDDQKRQDAFELLEIFKEATGEQAVLWGPSIVGFGEYHYKYESGREGDSMLAGFSPRKNALTLYIMGGFDQYEDLLGRLGKFKQGKGCLYVKKLTDIDQEALKDLIRRSAEHMSATH